MPSLSFLDSSFVLFESDDAPFHVSVLWQLEPPRDQQGSFGRQLYTRLLSYTAVQPPFNYKLDLSLFHMPRWQAVPNVDIRHHVQLAVLPEPGTREQLAVLAGEIHSQRPDRAHPLWQLWIIEGQADGQVAILFKCHHSQFDGMRLLRLVTTCCTTDPDDPDFRPFWQYTKPFPRHPAKQSNGITGALRGAVSSASQQVERLPELLRVGGRLAQGAMRLGDSPLKAPFFNVSKTRLNRNPGSERNVAWARFPLALFRSLGKMTGTSINDVLLTVCDIALLRYYQAHGWIARKPIMALMPLSLQEENNQGLHGNNIAYGLVELGTPGKSAGERLLAINRHSSRVKSEVHKDPTAYNQIGVSASAISFLEGRLKLNKLLPSACNLILSNVQGPKQAMYFAGAKMTEAYPFSVLSPDQTLNITYVSYDDHMHFGLVGCKRAFPDLDQMPGHLADAVDALQQDLLIQGSRTVDERLAKLRQQRRAEGATAEQGVEA